MLEPFVILRRDRATPGVPIVQAPEFYAQDGGLNFVEAAVDALDFVQVLDARAIISQDANAVGEVVAIGGDGSAIAQRAKFFPG